VIKITMANLKGAFASQRPQLSAHCLCIWLSADTTHLMQTACRAEGGRIGVVLIAIHGNSTLSHTWQQQAITTKRLQARGNKAPLELRGLRWSDALVR